MRLAKLGLLAMSICLVGQPGAAQSAASSQTAAFAGTYAVRGSNPGGTGGYSGTMVVRPRGEAFDVTWTIGTQEFRGVGIGVGDTLSIAYPSAGGAAGIAVYRADSVVSMSGVFTFMGGTGQLGRENAQRR